MTRRGAPDTVRPASTPSPEELRRLGLQTRLLQELGRQWTAPVGPINGEETRQVVALFVR